MLFKFIDGALKTHTISLCSSRLKDPQFELAIAVNDKIPTANVSYFVRVRYYDATNSFEGHDATRRLVYLYEIKSLQKQEAEKTNKKQIDERLSAVTNGQYLIYNNDTFSWGGFNGATGTSASTYAVNSGTATAATAATAGSDQPGRYAYTAPQTTAPAALATNNLTTASNGTAGILTAWADDYATYYWGRPGR